MYSYNFYRARDCPSGRYMFVANVWEGVSFKFLFVLYLKFKDSVSYYRDMRLAGFPSP
jgi:hypothetical protein